MKKINYKTMILTILVSLLPIILGLIFFDKLPDSIAIHFNLNGDPDNYLSKTLFIFVMPIMMSILQIILCYFNDTKDDYKEANKKASSVYVWLIPILSIVLYSLTIFYSLGNTVDIRKSIMIILGIILIITGNYLPKTKGNNFMRINKNIIYDYDKAKKIAGYLTLFTGVLLILSISFEPIVSAAIIILFIFSNIILYFYSINKK